MSNTLILNEGFVFLHPWKLSSARQPPNNQLRRIHGSFGTERIGFDELKPSQRTGFCIVGDDIVLCSNFVVICVAIDVNVTVR